MDKCPICLEIMDKKDLIKTNCDHKFHFLCYCINFLVYTDDKCPICRKIQKKIDISGKKNGFRTHLRYLVFSYFL